MLILLVFMPKEKKKPKKVEEYQRNVLSLQHD